jgi:ubiquinone/menaquinone biosynthesis C-methylase UbiE
MQKDIFLSGEGDAFISRNRTTIESDDWQKQDLLYAKLRQLDLPTGTRALEIGCGEGSRLARLRQDADWHCAGIDPSALGVTLACKKGIDAKQATADNLPFADAIFDVVIFGFCLYLCDRTDLFRIAAEADRVLKKSGWLIIYDFYADNMYSNDYKHNPAVHSYKMDYRQLFSWHPFYTCLAHQIFDYAGKSVPDNPDNWTALSILRKCDVT